MAIVVESCRGSAVPDAAEMTPRGLRPSWQVYVGVGLVAFAVLFVEVEITRIFSVMIWYHFGFFVISTVLLGFSAAGIALELSDRWRRAEPARLLAAIATAFSVTLVVSFWCVTNLPFVRYVPMAGRHSVAADILWAASLSMVLAPPFFLAGAFLCLALMLFPLATTSVYGVDLLGSGLGAIAAVLALGPFTGQQSVLLCPVVAALAAFVLSTAARPRLSVARVMCWIGYVVVLFGLILRADVIFPVGSSKVWFPISKDLQIKRIWNSLSCVDFFRNTPHLGLWGLSKRWTGPLPEQIGIEIDRWALTSIIRFGGDPTSPELGIFDYLPSFLPYRLLLRPRVLVIGSGGGQDVLAALHFDARAVTAVELNPDIVRTIQKDFADFSGRIYDQPRVRTVVAEGRNFIERSPETYDLVQLDGVDTYAATQAGAFSLAENYLYTSEAFDRYLERLTPTGILAMTRWVDRGQSLRLLATAEAALSRAGVVDSRAHAILVASEVYSVLMVRKTPFEAEDVLAITTRAGELGFTVLYHPGMREENDYVHYMNAADKDGFRERYPYRIDPTTDDSPFFFEQTKLGTILSTSFNALGATGGQGILVIVFVEFALFATVFLVVPLLLRRPGGRRIVLGWRALAFFFAVGLGYIVIEIALIQRLVLLLGHPVYALSVVLAGLLCASGLGSLSGGLVRAPGRARAMIAALAVAVLALVYATVLGGVVAHLIGTSAAPRFAAALAIIGPIGFAMGMPFPAVLEIVRGERGGAAWAWAANGCASVGGSAIAILLAMRSGFTTVLTLGAIAYGVAALALLLGPVGVSALESDPLATATVPPLRGPGSRAP